MHCLRKQALHLLSVCRFLLLTIRLKHLLNGASPLVNTNIFPCPLAFPYSFPKTLLSP